MRGIHVVRAYGLDRTKLNKLTYFQGENNFGDPHVTFHWFLLSTQSGSLYYAIHSIASQTNIVSALKIESILIHVSPSFSVACSLSIKFTTVCLTC